MADPTLRRVVGHVPARAMRFMCQTELEREGIDPGTTGCKARNL